MNEPRIVTEVAYGDQLCEFCRVTLRWARFRVVTVVGEKVLPSWACGYHLGHAVRWEPTP